MNVKPIIFGGLAYVLWRGVTKLKAVQQFTYNVSSMPAVKLSGSLATVTIQIQITNTTAERFNIQKVFGLVSINERTIGQLSSAAPFSINGYATALVSISIVTDLSNTIIALLTALTDKQKGLIVSVNGSVVTDTVSVPMIISKKIS